MASVSIDVSRQSFRLEAAPRKQRCCCKCGQWIAKGQLVHVRPNLGRSGGHTRIIDLEDHYRDWLEVTAKAAAAVRAASDKEFSRYLQ